MKMPKVEQLAVERIEPNTWNPNAMDEKLQRQLAENIRRFGFNQPLLVRPHPRKDGWYEIVDGEHRWQTARLEGREQVDAVVVDIDDSLAMVETIAMNRLRGEMAPADVAVLLKDVQDEIPYAELEKFSGYTMGELEKLDGLLDYDWQELQPRDEEEWHTLGWKMPREAAQVIVAEIERLKEVLGSEYDHLALELMVVNSAGLVT